MPCRCENRLASFLFPITIISVREGGRMFGPRLSDRAKAQTALNISYSHSVRGTLSTEFRLL